MTDTPRPDWNDVVQKITPYFVNAFPEGEAYTEAEYRAWLEAAGFTDVARERFPGFDHSLITARTRE
ncbi:MAG TPA: hypothetical protein VNN07_11530 [Candidatus Tectomicrobia bacterium]|nr:hypothetical protein [Candidatus Tectomicrobia bacterium]